VVRKAIDAFKSRDRAERRTGAGKATVGFEEKFVLGHADTILDVLKKGKVKGVVAIVGCTNLTSGGHDVLIKGLAEELLKRDIMVWTSGWVAYSLQGPGIHQLPRGTQVAPSLGFWNMHGSM
jgi:carbon-monoxide dehydrogenase catalytic subunit